MIAVQGDLPSVTAVVNEFPAVSQTFIRRKLDGLCSAGMDVQVAASRFAEPSGATGFPYLCVTPWVSPHAAISLESRSAWASMVRSIPSSWRTDGRARHTLATAPILAVETDIVHFEFSGIAVTYLDHLAALAKRSRIAVSCRGAAEQITPLHDPTRQRQLAEVFDAASLIHCVSDDMRQTVEAYGAPPARILVNRPAVPVAEFAELRRPARPDSGPVRVLSIGRLHWKKGFDDGLRALAGLRDRGVGADYRIAGEGPEREKLEFMLHELGLGGVVELLGSCAQSRIKELLVWADVLLLPSLSEGIANVALEAMSAGVPVVSTRCGGMAEVIEDGSTGMLVDVGDTVAMTDRIETIAKDPDLAAGLSLRAAAYADDNLDISGQIQRFMRGYQLVLPG